MFRRSSLALAMIAACGGGAQEQLDPSSPAETAPTAPTCPSEAAPELCRDLASSADTSNKHDLAWAYTVLECESPHAALCVPMWQRYGKRAPSQTDALSVLHSACTRNPSACKELAYWHRTRGHSLAAAVYEKRSANPTMPRDAAGLAADLATIMHVSGAPPTAPIAQMIGHEMPAPVIHAAPATVASATKKKPAAKAWPTHAASLVTSSESCNGVVILDRHPVSLDQCIGEVRPLEEDKIALRNRCNRAITVGYAGARPNHSTYANQIRLEAYEARSLDLSHEQIGELTYAPCLEDCKPSSAADDVMATWKGAEGLYYCAGGLKR